VRRIIGGMIRKEGAIGEDKRGEGGRGDDD
jgi:hypothetical protein